jgi:excinuclease ABC subunit A
LGGDRGGRIVAEGTPEDVAETKGSLTGQYLKRVLPKRAARRRPDGRPPEREKVAAGE